MQLILSIIFLGQQAAASSIVRQEVNYRGDQNEYVSQAVKCDPGGMSECCPGRNLPNFWTQRVPKDVIPQLDEHWRLQLPCETISTYESRKGGASQQISTCDGDYQRLWNRGSSPGYHTVQLHELHDFILMPKQYSIGSKKVCSGAMYPAESNGNQMVVFHVPVAGTTTPGSKNTRIELRQMEFNNFRAMAGFSLKDGYQRTLRTTMSIVHAPQKYRSTSVVQIFNAGYSEDKDAPSPKYKGGGPFIEVIIQKCKTKRQKLPNGRSCTVGNIGIGVWKDGKFGYQGGFLFEEYTLGTKFELEIDIPGDGKIVFRYRHADQTVDDWITKTMDCDDPGVDDRGEAIRECLWYSRGKGNAAYPHSNGLSWKIGNYVQKAPEEDPSDYALVHVYKAKISGS